MCVSACNEPAWTTSDAVRQSGGDGGAWRVMDQHREGGEVRGRFQLRCVRRRSGRRGLKTECHVGV